MKKRDEWEVLFEAMATGDSSRAIMNQEKRGQGDLVHSDVLPRQCPRTSLETLGFKFGEVVDDLFIQVTLPAGWKKVPTDHSMWSHIIDEQGRVRAAIFYKAAFYDRSAHMSLERRFSYHSWPGSGYNDPNYDSNAPREGAVTDCGKVIWRTETKAAKDDRKGEDALEAEAKAWLEQRYPDWENPLAYWDASA